MFTKTRHRYLFRRKPSGISYFRKRVGKRTICQSLQTSSASVAQRKLAELVRQGSVEDAPPELSTIRTVGDCLDVFRSRIAADVRTKPRTKEYWLECTQSLERSWPELAELPTSRVTADACRSWATKFAGGSSPTRYNNTMSVMRHAFSIAIEAGLRTSNPAIGKTSGFWHSASRRSTRECGSATKLEWPR